MKVKKIECGWCGRRVRAGLRCRRCGFTTFSKPLKRVNAGVPELVAGEAQMDIAFVVFYGILVIMVNGGYCYDKGTEKKVDRRAVGYSSKIGLFYSRCVASIES